MLSTIVDYFVDLWNDLFGGETVPIDVPENFNELYVLKSTDDTGAVKEAKVIIEENFNGEKQLVGEYNGFETDICGYINNTVMIGINEVNSFSLEGVLECSHDTGVFKVKMEEEPVSGELGEIGGEKFSPIDWWWIRLTGRLRPQWLK